MSKMVKSVVATGILAASVLASGQAAAEFSANVALTSNYIWRGISQSNSQPALQGGFDYAHDSGFYAGVWGSNIDWFDSGKNTGPDNNESVELDTYLGFSNTLNNGIGYDVGFVRYNYPGAVSNVDFSEMYIGGSYGMFSAKYTYSDSFAGPHMKSANYLEAGVDFTLAQDIGVSLHVGKSSGAYFSGGNDYTDYKVGISKDFGGFGFALDYTDISGITKTTSGALQNDAQVAFTISKSM